MCLLLSRGALQDRSAVKNIEFVLEEGTNEQMGLVFSLSPKPLGSGPAGTDDPKPGRTTMRREKTLTWLGT